MGLFDGVPVLGEAEDLVGSGVDATLDLAEDTVEWAEEAISDIPEIASDPFGYAKSQLEDVSWSSLKTAVGGGVDLLAQRIGVDDELSALVAGVEGFVDDIADIVAQVLQALQCVTWVQTPAFWALVTGLIGARAARLVNSKEDCKRYIQVSSLVQSIGAQNLPIMSMLPCIIEAAFIAPLPAAQGGVGISPGVGAKAK